MYHHLQGWVALSNDEWVKTSQFLNLKIPLKKAKYSRDTAIYFLEVFVILVEHACIINDTFLFIFKIRSVMKIMLRNMIWYQFIQRNMKYTNRACHEKIKSGLLVSTKNMKLLMNSFFWTMEQILKDLSFLSTKVSLYFKKKQKDTSLTNICWVSTFLATILSAKTDS